MRDEDPHADVVEQQRPLAEDDDPVEDPGGMPLEAEPADVADQHRVVPQDDDERYD